MTETDTLTKVDIHQIKFEVVSDDFRTESRGTLYGPLVNELLAGSTVKVIGKLSGPSRYYRWASTIGKRFRRREFEDYTIVWLEDKEEKTQE